MRLIPWRRKPQKPRAVSRTVYAVRNVYGGLVNMMTGLGTAIDKVRGSFYRRRLWQSREQLTTIFEESGLAYKAVTAPVDDCFNRWREWWADADELEQYEADMRVRERMKELMIAGRLYGSGLAVMMTTEAPLDSPLDPRMIREGDLKAVIIVDRFSASIDDYERDPFSTEIEPGEPRMYTITPPYVNTAFRVHPSRVLRFDGIDNPSPTASRGERWGIPVIQKAIESIKTFESTYQGTGHLVQKALVDFIEGGDFEQAQAAGRGGQAEEELGKFNQRMGIYRVGWIPDSAEFKNRTFNFGGLSQIIEQMGVVVSAMVGLPVTRLMGRSPAGMNATGEGDQSDNAKMVASLQKDIRPLLDRFDAVAARSYGMTGELPRYDFPSILEQSQGEKYEAGKMKAEGLSIALADGAIDASEYRKALSGDAVFGELEGDPPDPPPVPVPAPMPVPALPDPANGNGARFTR